jgi:hypothetical protein
MDAPPHLCTLISRTHFLTVKDRHGWQWFAYFCTSEITQERWIELKGSEDRQGCTKRYWLPDDQHELAPPAWVQKIPRQLL